MAESTGITGGRVIVCGNWWNEHQDDLRTVVSALNDITGAIAAHQHLGKYEAEELIDHIDGDIRSIRMILEAAIAPF